MNFMGFIGNNLNSISNYRSEGSSRGSSPLFSVPTDDDSRNGPVRHKVSCSFRSQPGKFIHIFMMFCFDFGWCFRCVISHTSRHQLEASQRNKITRLRTVKLMVPAKFYKDNILSSWKWDFCCFGFKIAFKLTYLTVREVALLELLYRGFFLCKNNNF